MEDGGNGFCALATVAAKRTANSRVANSAPKAGGLTAFDLLDFGSIPSYRAVNFFLGEMRTAACLFGSLGQEGGIVLMAWSEVSVLRINSKGWETLRRTKLDFDLAPLAIVRLVRWPVSEDILVAQLHANFCRNIWQVA